MRATYPVREGFLTFLFMCLYSPVDLQDMNFTFFFLTLLCQAFCQGVFLNYFYFYFCPDACFLLNPARWLVSWGPCSQSGGACHGGRNKCKMAPRIKPASWLLFCDQQNYFSLLIRLKFLLGRSAEGWGRLSGWRKGASVFRSARKYLINERLALRGRDGMSVRPRVASSRVRLVWRVGPPSPPLAC